MIAFVILHYQTLKYTMECVNSIIQNVSQKKLIIIVDNKSPNNSGIILKKLYNTKEIIVLLNDNNSGFAGGNNLGYKKAKQYNPRYIVVLNNDTIIKDKTFYSDIEEAYNKYNFDVLGPDILSLKTKRHQNPHSYKNFTYNYLKCMYYKLWLKNKFKFIFRLKYILDINKKSIQINQKYEYDNNIRIGVVLHGSFCVFSDKYISKHNCCFYNSTFMHLESFILHYLGTKEKLIFLYYPNIKVDHCEDISTEYCYGNTYRKDIFLNKCLLESCSEFLKIFKDKSAKIK